MSNQGSMRYFVVIGKEAVQIQDVPEELASHYSSQVGFTSRSEAEQCMAKFQRVQNSNRTPKKYPNSSTHWEEYSPPTPSTPQRLTPSPSPHPPAPQVVPVAVAPVNKDPIVLSDEQLKVLHMVKAGRNVFFTGPAGTGKSVLLREIMATLRSADPPVSVAVTASTGIAGINIGGSTLHSFAGIGLGKEKVEVLASRIAGSFVARQRWRAVDCLIVDEISMIDGRLFDKLEYIARVVRESEAPFGGLQLVLSGDFCQLPPVPEKASAHRIPSTFAFDAKSWSRCISEPILLTRVFRQSDRAFVDILSAMRVGNLSDDHIKSLAALSRPLTYADGIEPTSLFPTRMEAQACNSEKLNALSGQGFTYNSMDASGIDVYGSPVSKQVAERILDDEIALSRVTFKVGAQVMLIQNIVQGCLVNGSCGKVIDFMTTHDAIQKQIQIAEMKKKDRPNALERISNKRPRIDSDDEIFQSLNEYQFDKNQKWPLVNFTSGKLLLCAPVDFCVEGFRGNVEAKRTQVPLILAWALSMHKSQGQTLERVKIDLGKVFEKGQAYVAVSRATTMEHLEILNFNPLKIEAHPRVIAWQNGWMPRSTNESRNAASGSSLVTPKRVTVTALPTPRSIAKQREPGIDIADVDDPDQTLWDAEMDCDEAISNYYDDLQN